MATKQQMTGCRNSSDKTDVKAEARQRMLEKRLDKACVRLAQAVGPEQRKAALSDIAAIQEEM